ncbi:Uncharacterised protein [Mycobacteroides abscessus subsp. abscessus]|nr:Uncharacterised protein [Mycobacteroides abscessus subsp. abscessus]
MCQAQSPLRVYPCAMPVGASMLLACYTYLKLLFDRTDRLPLVPKSAEYSAHILSIRLIV